MGERRLDVTVVRLAMAVASRMPAPLLQPVLDVGLAGVRRRHPDLFDTLAAFGPVLFAVDATDLPLMLCLRSGRQPRLFLRHRPVEEADAVVRGSFETLLDLVEGRVDGDTLFFTRRLEVEGRTDVVVAVRNAVDGRGLALAGEVSATLGPLGPLMLQLRAVLATGLETLMTVAPGAAKNNPGRQNTATSVEGGVPWN